MRRRSASFKPIDCIERGALLGRAATAVLAGLPFEIAEREIRTAREAFERQGDGTHLVRAA